MFLGPIAGTVFLLIGIFKLVRMRLAGCRPGGDARGMRLTALIGPRAHRLAYGVLGP
jgi:hypothetical protein